ncbi:hypothetical protein Dimus_001934 [Dionaea muscipula]
MVRFVEAGRMALCAPSVSWPLHVDCVQEEQLLASNGAARYLECCAAHSLTLYCPQLCYMKLLEAGRRAHHEAAMKLAARGSAARSQGLLPASHRVRAVLVRRPLMAPVLPARLGDARMVPKLPVAALARRGHCSPRCAVARRVPLLAKPPLLVGCRCSHGGEAARPCPLHVWERRCSAAQRLSLLACHRSLRSAARRATACRLACYSCGLLRRGGDELLDEVLLIVEGLVACAWYMANG